MAFQNLNDVFGDWFSVQGEVTDDVVEGKNCSPFWQFRVAITPTCENALKAARALQAIPQFQTKPHPEFKVFIPDQANPLDTWDGTLQGGDRDQRGKEICVYMEYSPVITPWYYDNGYPQVDYLKQLMLDMWEVLNKAGVEMAYVTPGPGEKEILVDDGTLTPFSYSSFKPYTGRHGVLHSDQYNPNNFRDPLAAVKLSPADLKQRGITPLKAGCSAKRLSYQRQHHAAGIKSACVALSTGFDEDKTYTKAVSHLAMLPKVKETELKEWITLFSQFLKNPGEKQFHEPFGALGECGRLIFSTAGKALLGQDLSQARKALEALQDTINTERKTAVDEMLDVLPASSDINRGQLERQFDRNPFAFHRLYQRCALLAQEKKTIAREHRRLQDLIPTSYPASYYELDKDDTLLAARNLLNDYTKSNSRLSRALTFHWARHHTAAVNEMVKAVDTGEVKTMDDLIQRLESIQGINPKGSLARRLELIVCRHVDAQCQADSKKEPDEEVLLFV